MVRETTPPCCHIEFCISLRNLSVIVKTVQPAPTSQTQLPLQEHQIMKTCSACFTSSKREPQSTRDEHNMRNMRRGGCPPRVLILRSDLFIYLFFSQQIWNCKNLTKKSSNFIGLLLLNLLIIQSFKEDVQHQNIFSGERTHTSTSIRFPPGPFSQQNEW